MFIIYLKSGDGFTGLSTCNNMEQVKTIIDTIRRNSSNIPKFSVWFYDEEKDAETPVEESLTHSEKLSQNPKT